MRMKIKSTTLKCGSLIYLCIFISCVAFLLNGSVDVPIDNKDRTNKPLKSQAGTIESDDEESGIDVHVWGEAEEFVQWEFECNVDTKVKIAGGDDNNDHVVKIVSEGKKKDSGVLQVKKGEGGTYYVTFICRTDDGEKEKIKITYKVVWDYETIFGLDVRLLIVSMVVLIILIIAIVSITLFLVFRSKKKKKIIDQQYK